MSGTGGEAPVPKASQKTTRLKWNCGACTYENGGGARACEICKTPRPLETRQWECSACTFLNRQKDSVCKICTKGRTFSERPEHSRMTRRLSSHQSQSLGDDVAALPVTRGQSPSTASRRSQSGGGDDVPPSTAAKDFGPSAQPEIQHPDRKDEATRDTKLPKKTASDEGDAGSDKPVASTPAGVEDEDEEKKEASKGPLDSEDGKEPKAGAPEVLQSDDKEVRTGAAPALVVASGRSAKEDAGGAENGDDDEDDDEDDKEGFDGEYWLPTIKATLQRLKQELKAKVQAENQRDFEENNAYRIEVGARLEAIMRGRRESAMALALHPGEGAGASDGSCRGSSMRECGESSQKGPGTGAKGDEGESSRGKKGKGVDKSKGKVTVKPVYLEKHKNVPKFASWIFLDRNMLMKEEESVVGKRRIYHDPNGEETVLCSESDEEYLNDDGEKRKFSAEDDFLISGLFEAHTNHTKVAEELSRLLHIKKEKIKGRYDFLTKDKRRHEAKATAAAQPTTPEADPPAVLRLSSPHAEAPDGEQGVDEGTGDNVAPSVSPRGEGHGVRSSNGNGAPSVLAEGAGEEEEDKSYLQKSLEENMDSITHLFCRRCRIFDCRVHGCDQTFYYPCEQQPTDYNPSDEVCSKDCINLHKYADLLAKIRPSLAKAGSLGTDGSGGDDDLPSNENSPKEGEEDKGKAPADANDSGPSSPKTDDGTPAGSAPAPKEDEDAESDGGVPGGSESRKRKREKWEVDRKKAVPSSEEKGKKPTEDEEDDWTPLEKDLFAEGLRLFGRDSCPIAQIYFMDLRTCADVAKRILSHATGSDGRHLGTGHEGCEEERKGWKSSGRKKWKVRGKWRKPPPPSALRKKKASAVKEGNADEPESMRADDCKHYFPCGCKGSCGPDCNCLKAGSTCEKFCGCSKACSNRWHGCRCKSDSCRTKRCDCVQANRECDPDVCRNCSIPCGGPPSNADASEMRCQNMKLLLRQHKRVLLGASDVAGWGAFLRDTVIKDEYLGEYTGELISHYEADKRGKIYDRINSSFLFNLNDQFVLDAFRKGNKLKFANHSPKPNCYAKVVMVEGDHRVGIFSGAKILGGKELFYDYQYKAESAPSWAKKEGGSKTKKGVNRKQAQKEATFR